MLIIEPRGRQVTALNLLRQNWKQNNSFLLYAPVGFGKKAIAAFIADGFTSRNLRVMFVAPYTVLIDQTAKRFVEYGLTHCNTRAALNTAFLKKFIAPSGIRNLIIFADADKNAAGHAAAFECAYKNLMSKHNDVQSVSVRWPERGDFNDVITDGLQVYEWVFEKIGR